MINFKISLKKMSKNWVLDSKRNWVNSSDKAGIVTDSSWYNG